jgi:hypothetical protein
MDPTGEIPEIPEIPAPPDAIYNSHDDAFNALKQHGLQCGYGFRVSASRPVGSDIKTRIYYCCDKSGTHKSQAKIRSTGTRTSGCSFKLVIFQKDDQWRLEVTNKHHNHPPSLNPSAHHIYRRRTSNEKKTIESMSKAGTAPKQILTALRQSNPDTLVAASDIHNDRKILRADYLKGRPPIEALLDDLSTPEWVFDIRRDQDNHVQSLFFAHEKQIELLLANPDVLLMDCTYRTNKYRLPLLHILGCTNLGKFFSAGFCFLRNENEEDYHWAISTFLNRTGTPEPRVLISDQEDALKNAARRIMPSVPQLLCVWHVNMNVLTKAQQVWRDANGKTKEEKEAIIEKRSQFMTRWNQVSLNSLCDMKWD